MLKCKDAAFLLSQAQDRELSLGERVNLRFHLFICDKCTNFSRQLQLMRKANRRYSDQNPEDYQ
jgi:hypothetical protein